MKNINNKQIDVWLTAHNITLDRNELAAGFSHQYSGKLPGDIETRKSWIKSFASSLPRSECLVYFRTWNIFSDDIAYAALQQFRIGIGCQDELSGSPGHIFSSEEWDFAWALLLLGSICDSDVILLTKSRLAMSIDHHFEVYISCDSDDLFETGAIKRIYLPARELVNIQHWRTPLRKSLPWIASCSHQDITSCVVPQGDL